MVDEENTQPQTYDTEAFKREYIELCLKHGFEIGGCGCCGSPWIESANSHFCENGLPDIPWPQEVVEEQLDHTVEQKAGSKLGEFKF